MLRDSSLGAGLLGAVVLGLSAVGCAGDDDDDGGRDGGGTPSQFDSGVSGTKPIFELSSDEARQLCTAYDAYLSARVTPEAMKRYACNLQAGLSAQSDAECGAK